MVFQHFHLGKYVSTCLVAVLFVAGCGGGSSSLAVPPNVPATNTLQIGVRLPGFPHEVDFYIPAGATKAVVFLHGGSGHSYTIPKSLGLSAVFDRPPTFDEVNWAWLQANGIIAVFPQGQNIPIAPSAFTWSNHAMTSGVDDQAFLVALAAYLRTTYAPTVVAVAGHSMGGVMVNRMWCESPQTFDAHVAIAGPASAFYLDPDTPCNPAVRKPYMGIIGSSDSIMQTASAWTSPTWTISSLVSETPAFIDKVVIGEWAQHQRRAALTCGQAPALADSVVVGNVESWSSCGGTTVMRLVDGAEHGINFIEARAGKLMIDYLAEFIAPI